MVPDPHACHSAGTVALWQHTDDPDIDTDTDTDWEQTLKGIRNQFLITINK